MSQTNAMAWRVSQEFKTEFSLIGTGILNVCECPEIVKEQWNRLGENPCLSVRVCVHACVRVFVCTCMYIWQFANFLISNFLLLTSNF